METKRLYIYERATSEINLKLVLVLYRRKKRLEIVTIIFFLERKCVGMRVCIYGAQELATYFNEIG